ncbi:bifunctional metallophosphatase/5'-nucleotidase [Bacteroides sedimenti]
MKRISISFCFFLLLTGTLFAQPKEVTIKLIHTSDIHGQIFSYDYIKNCSFDGGLSRVSSYVNEQRRKYPNRVLLLDGGDILQGKPSAYYYNYLDTISPHLCAQMFNYIGYNAIAIGNHEIETGHSVYERWVRLNNAPVLGANVLREDGSCYLKPYEVFEIEGVKIAVLGLLTPSIPVWVPEKKWKGLRFEDMEASARKWMNIIREKEDPDIVVGLFHSGVIYSKLEGMYNENASAEVARNVPGFDVVLAGHDHTTCLKKVLNAAGDSVLVINPGYGAFQVSDVLFDIKLNNGKVVAKSVEGNLQRMKEVERDSAFLRHFDSQIEDVKKFIFRPIGKFSKSVSVRDAYFGPSAYIDIVHSIQLQETGAEVSFTAPLSFDAQVDKGMIRVYDLFNLYQFENQLYTIDLTGTEIRNYLEFSYNLWINEMKSPDDHLLLLKKDDYTGKYIFQDYPYRFDSAAGIIYTVDVSKPFGSRVVIEKMANGKPFDLKRHYKVAINSYRACGGGGHLTSGAGIEKDSLNKRILATSPMDLRYYLMEWIVKKGNINPKTLNQWRFIPENWVKEAAKRDKKLLFETIDN